MVVSAAGASVANITAVSTAYAEDFSCPSGVTRCYNPDGEEVESKIDINNLPAPAAGTSDKVAEAEKEANSSKNQAAEARARASDLGTEEAKKEASVAEEVAKEADFKARLLIKGMQLASVSHVHYRSF